jgi:peptide/nickel transport system substrate-binding protein
VGRVSRRPDAQALRAWARDVAEGRLARRSFIARLGALGVAAPLASLLLHDEGVAQGAEYTYKPTKRGGGGTVRLLYWQGPTLLNPHFATGTKDEEGCRLFYESLATWSAEGQLIPQLAAELPSRANGGLAADGKSVVWKLKRGVTWHDGQPFTADDVVFNHQYATDSATAAVTAGTFGGVNFEKVDSHTVRVVFDKPTPFWPGIYAQAMLVPKHLFAPYIGAKSREAPANLKPVGTGPYKFAEFKPGDLLRGEINNSYHLPNRPHFDMVEIKGGGDAASAARAVLQTGEYDFAWNLLVEDELLKRMEQGGKGRVSITFGGSIEHIQLNMSDPNTELDGERSHPKSRHPILSDPAVRQAFALLVDRPGIQEFIYGRIGVATANHLNNPAQFKSKNLKVEFNVDKANALLEGAGWKRGADGIREKGGRKLKLVFQTSVSAPRQKVQAIVKQACGKAGIDLELKAVVGSVFFSSDVANPDTYGKFWADVQMYNQSQGPPDPVRLMQSFVSWEASSKDNKWLGLNRGRWFNDEYDKLYSSAEFELDAAKRAAMFIRMNDLVCGDCAVVPIAHRPAVAGMARTLRAPLSGWSNDTATIAHWYRDSAA